MKSLNLGKPCI